jgi:hypothetical protein
MAGKFKRTMMALYDELSAADASVNTFLFNLFGKNPGERVVSESEKLEIDIIRDDRHVAVDVLRGGGLGNGNTATRYTTKEYAPPLYAEEAPITASMLNKPLPGKSEYDQVSRAEAFMIHAARVAVRESHKILRALERQAAEALLSGTVTLKNTESIDFKKKASHSVVPVAKWDAAGNPITDIQALCDATFRDGKMKPDTSIFSPEAWDAFINNSNAKAYLDNRRIEPGRVNPSEVMDGATYQGRVWIGDYHLDMYTYNEFYFDGTNNVNYMTPGSVIVMNRTARLQVGFAAVELLPEAEQAYRDLNMPPFPELAKGEMVPYAYPKLPNAVFAGVQSAPLVMPTAIDTIGTLDSVTS